MKRPEIRWVPVSDLRPAASRIFREHTPEEVESIAASIRRLGGVVLHNLVVRPLPDGGYEIISGHGRAKAAAKLGLEEVPALVLDADAPEAEMALIDANVEVRPPSPMELARAIRRRKNLLGQIKHVGRPGKENWCRNDTNFPGRSLDVVAREMGMSYRHVARYDALNNLIPEFQALVESGRLGVMNGSQLALLPPEVQHELYEALGDAVADLKADEIKRLKEEQERGYLVLRALQRRVEELEAELSSLQEAHGTREDLERELEALRRKRRELTYDVMDREQALRVQVERFQKPRAALLWLVESLASRVP
ncbi:MAG: ParB/RepB/Spo0J family partition protein, partial [Bacillota bacterium]